MHDPNIPLEPLGELQNARELVAHLSHENARLSSENQILLGHYKKFAMVYNRIVTVFNDQIPEMEKIRKVKRLIYGLKDSER